MCEDQSTVDAFIAAANEELPEYAPYYVNADCHFMLGHERRVNLDAELDAIKRAFVEARKDQCPKVSKVSVNPLPGITRP